MDLCISILNIVLPVFLVICLGFGLQRTAIVDDEFLYKLNQLVYWVALPLLLFYKIGTADFSQSFNIRLLIGVVVAIVLLCVFSYGFAVLRGYGPQVKGTFSQGAFRGNVAYVGLPIVFNAFGEQGLATAGILLGFLVPLMSFLSIFVLVLPHRENEGKKGATFWLHQVLLNPLILASLLGVVWSYLQLPVPLFIDRSLNIATSMAMPLALIAIGASFSFKKFQGDMSTAMLAIILKLIALPVVAALLLVLMGVQAQELAIGVIFAATPTASSAYIMAKQMRGDAPLAGSIIMVSTLLSIVSYSVALYILETLQL